MKSQVEIVIDQLAHASLEADYWIPRAVLEVARQLERLEHNLTGLEATLRLASIGARKGD